MTVPIASGPLEASSLLADSRAAPVLSLVAGLLVVAIVAFEVVGYVADGQVSGMVLASVVASLIAFVIAGLNAAEVRRPGSGPAFVLHRGALRPRGRCVLPAPGRPAYVASSL
jgi:hypothetical protein